MNRGHQAGTLLRIGICIVILFYLIRKVDLESFGSLLADTLTHWPWLLAGVLFTFAGLFVGAVRWKHIMAAQNLALPLRHVLRIYFIGQFFNAFMLGACGGDVARAYYATRDAPHRKAEAASTVFIDRAVGLFAMIVFCCGMIILRFPLFLDYPGNHGPGVLMFVFLGGAVVALFAVFRRNLFEHFNFFRNLEKDTRLGPLIRRTYEAVYLYRNHKLVMVAAIGHSILNLLFLTLACWSFGKSLHVTAPLLDVITLFPIISVIAAIPITPGSMGVREGLFVSMFRSVGVEPAASISMSLLVYAGSLLWSAVGGLLFLAHSAKTGRGLTGEIDAVKQHPDPASGAPPP